LFLTSLFCVLLSASFFFLLSSSFFFVSYDSVREKKINKMKGNLNNHDSTGKIKNKKKLETIGNGPNEWISPLDWPKQK